METKKFLSELSFSFRALGRLLRKAFRNNKAHNLEIHYNTFSRDPYMNCAKAHH